MPEFKHGRLRHGSTDSVSMVIVVSAVVAKVTESKRSKQAFENQLRFL